MNLTMSSNKYWTTQIARKTPKMIFGFLQLHLRSSYIQKRDCQFQEQFQTFHHQLKLTWLYSKFIYQKQLRIEK